MNRMQFKDMLRNKEEDRLLKSFECLIKIGKFNTADLYAEGFGIEKDIRNKIIKKVYSNYINSIDLIIKEELVDINKHKISEINEKIRFSKKLSEHYTFLNIKKLDEAINSTFNFYYKHYDYISKTKQEGIRKIQE